MNIKGLFAIVILVAAAGWSFAAEDPGERIHGDYIEVRSCDVYTGPCFANGEMGLVGKEAILVWSVREGTWNDVALDGLSVIAVVRTDQTLGDQRYQSRSGKALLIADAEADAKQRRALTDLAQTLACGLIEEVVEVKSSEIEVKVASCSKSGCASVKAGELVEVSTRCLGGQDHICGNEETFYPPLTPVQAAAPAFTQLAAFRDDALNCTWESVGGRSAFIGRFSR